MGLCNSFHRGPLQPLDAWLYICIQNRCCGKHRTHWLGRSLHGIIDSLWDNAWQAAVRQSHPCHESLACLPPVCCSWCFLLSPTCIFLLNDIPSYVQRPSATSQVDRRAVERKERAREWVYRRGEKVLWWQGEQVILHPKCPLLGDVQNLIVWMLEILL